MEIDLLKNYPKSNRDIKERANGKTDEARAIAKRFDREFFDGSRENGYGGFYYNPRFWKPVIPSFIKHWGLNASHSILDVGCAKGFMLHDFQESLPGISLFGIDVSEYAIENSIDSVKDQIAVGDAQKIAFADKSFDYTISINTIHNLQKDGVIQALQEIERVSKKGSFITVDAYRSDEEKERMLAWNLTAETILHVDEWRELFASSGYTGDYYWFIP